MSIILLQRYANREYRLTHQDIFSRKPSGGDKYKEVQAERYANAVNDAYVLSEELKQGEVASISDGRLKRHTLDEVNLRLGIRSLDIIDEFRQIAATPRKGGWGSLSRPTSFGRNARHRLLEAGAVVDIDCGKDAWEITLTLPGSTREAVRACAEWSGWLIDRLLRDVRREKCLHWFYVWEFHKKGRLHLHFLVAGREKDTKNIAHYLEYQWWELLWELSEKLEIDMFAKNARKTWRYEPSVFQSHTAQIQKSVAAYFSKYASKGLEKKSQGFTKYQKHCPSRWWGCSSHLKDRIKQTRRKYSLSVSKCTAKKIEIYLQSWLNDPGRITNYNYQFQLGKTANGTELGGGEVWINYYNDLAFARMQQWEKIAWDNVLRIAHDAGEYDYPTQDWNNLDRACPTPLADGITRYKNNLQHLETSTDTPHLTPLTRHPSLASKLRKARGTQPEATLALRALAVQYLTGGAGESQPEEMNFQPIQLELGIDNLLTPYYDSNVVNRLDP